MSRGENRLETIKVLRLIVKPKKINWDEIGLLLSKGLSVFIPIDRKSNWYAKRQLDKFGLNVKSYPTIWEGEDTFLYGYIFVPNAPKEKMKIVVVDTTKRLKSKKTTH